MAEIKNPHKKVKIEIRRASPALKIVICLLIVFSMAALIALRWVHNGIQQQTLDLTKEAAVIENANTKILEKTDELNSVQSVQDIAQDQLGLADPDTVVIDPE